MMVFSWSIGPAIYSFSIRFTGFGTICVVGGSVQILFGFYYFFASRYARKTIKRIFGKKSSVFVSSASVSLKASMVNLASGREREENYQKIE